MLLAFPTIVHASEVKLSPRLTHAESLDLEMIKGIELEVEHRDFIGWFAYDQTNLRLVGQETAFIQIAGAGLGYDWKLPYGFSLAGKIGYYYPVQTPRPTAKEGILRAMNNEIKYTENWGSGYINGHLSGDPNDPHYIYDTCKYEIKGNFGASVQGNWGLRLWRGLKAGMFVGFRFLQFEERLYANIANLGAEHGPHPWHEFYSHRNFGGGFFGVKLVWEW